MSAVKQNERSFEHSVLKVSAGGKDFTAALQEILKFIMTISLKAFPPLMLSASGSSPSVLVIIVTEF